MLSKALNSRKSLRFTLPKWRNYRTLPQTQYCRDKWGPTWSCKRKICRNLCISYRLLCTNPLGHRQVAEKDFRSVPEKAQWYVTQLHFSVLNAIIGKWGRWLTRGPMELAGNCDLVLKYDTMACHTNPHFVAADILLIQNLHFKSLQEISKPPYANI